MADRLLIVVNHSGYFLSHRLPIAIAAREAGFDVHVATAAGPMDDRVRRAGFEHHVLPLTRSGMHPIQEARAVWALYRLFRALRPDIVHLVTIKPVLYGGIMARFAGVPSMVAAVPGLGFIFLKRGWRGSLVRATVVAMYRAAFSKRNLRVIFQNTADRDSLGVAAGLTPNKIALIPGSGVDLDEFVPIAKAGGPPVVVLAARLLRDKGVAEFVEAAAILRRRGADARFRLVGAPDPGNPATVTDEELDAWRLAGVVELLGHRDDMARVLADADIVALPSYREGLPRVLIEAAACGRPVVTSDVPGCRDAILDGITGLLVPPRDAAALATAIESLLLDPPQRARMGQAGRALAEREFSIERVVAAHLAIYRALQASARG